VCQIQPRENEFDQLFAELPLHEAIVDDQPDEAR
jgi:hypothetical protein